LADQDLTTVKPKEWIKWAKKLGVSADVLERVAQDFSAAKK